MQNTSQDIKKFVKLGGINLNDGILKINIQRITNDPEKISLLSDYFFLLTKTDFIRPEVYDVLVKRETYNVVTKKYDITPTTLKNLVYNTSKSLFEDLIQDPYRVVVMNTLDAGNIGVLRGHIRDLIDTSNVLDPVDLQSHLLVDMDKYSDTDYNFNISVDTKQLEMLIKMLQPISKPYLETVFKRVDPKMMNYIGYLIRTPDTKLSPSAIKHKETMREIWWIPNE